MKKRIIKILKDPKLIAVASVVLSVVILLAVVPPLLFPRFTNWRELAEKNSQEEARFNTINTNVNTLISIDKANLEDFEQLVAKVIPEEQDRLRMVSIFNILVQNSGMVLKSLKVVTKTPAQTPVTPAAGVAQSTPGTPPTPGAQQPTAQPVPSASQGTITTPPVATPVVSKEYEISLVADGSVPAAIKLLDSLELVKRSVKVLDLSVGKGEEEKDSAASGGKIQVKANFRLALAENMNVSPEENIVISDADRQYLLDLLQKLTIDASPAKDPLGRLDPFR